MEINFGDGILMHQGKIHINVLLLLKIYKKKLIFYRNIKNGQNYRSKEVRIEARRSSNFVWQKKAATVEI